MTAGKMEIVGMHWTTSAATGKTAYTLCLKHPFTEYYSDSVNGRGCIGMGVESVYVNTIDCSNLNVGDHIEILYGKALRTKNGDIYQPINRIEKVK